MVGSMVARTLADLTESRSAAYIRGASDRACACENALPVVAPENDQIGLDAALRAFALSLFAAGAPKRSGHDQRKQVL